MPVWVSYSFAQKMIRLLLFALFATSALAGDEVPSIIGSWRSDAEATNAYLKKHAKLRDYQKKVFATFFGSSVVTFRADGTGSFFRAIKLGIMTQDLTTEACTIT